MWTGCVATPKPPAAGGTLESLRSTRNASAVSGRTCVPSEQRGVSGGLYSPGAALKRNRPGETPRRALAPPSLVGAELGLTGLVGLTGGWVAARGGAGADRGPMARGLFAPALRVVVEHLQPSARPRPARGTARRPAPPQRGQPTSEGSPGARCAARTRCA